MAENEISILISATDDVSKKLDVINKNIDRMAQNSDKQTKSLANSFDNATGSLIVLGNAAARVDSIFDSYNNMLLRIENAQTRVYEAQKNVRDAQYNLNKVMSDGSASSEDLAKAQDDLDTATNRLNMSQNNLARTMNSVTGTYIQIGVSVLTLAASYKQLGEAIKGVYLALAGPVGLVIGIIAAGAYIVWLTNKLGGIVELFKAVVRGAVLAGAALSDVLTGKDSLKGGSNYQRALNELDVGWFKLKSNLEGQSLSPIKMIDDLKNQFFNAVGSISDETAKLDYAISTPVESGVEKAIASIDKLENSFGRFSRMGELLNKYSSGPKYSGQGSFSWQWGSKVVSKQNDFISRPGQPAVPFSPNDTIIGVKSPGKLGGINVYIDNVYGVDADSIAEALQDKLRNAVIV